MAVPPARHVQAGAAFDECDNHAQAKAEDGGFPYSSATGSDGSTGV